MKTLVILILLLNSLCITAQSLDSLKDVLAKSNSDKETAQTYSQISEQLLYQNIDSAFVLIKQYVEFSKKNGNPYYLAQALNLLGNYYVLSGKIDSAIYYTENAETICKENQIFDSVFSRILSDKGYIEIERSQPFEALKLFKKALEIDSTLQSFQNVAADYSNIAQAYYKLNDYEKAAEMYTKASDLISKHNLFGPLNYVYSNVGQLFYAMRKYKKAEKYFMISLAYNKKNNIKYDLLIDYNNLASVYQKTQRINKAVEYYEKALSIAKEYNSFSDIAIINNNIGKIYSQSNKPKLALYHFQKSETLLKKIGAHDYLQLVLSNIGEVYITLEQYDKALSSFNSSLNLAKKHNNLKGKQVAYYALFDLHNRKEQYKKSIDFLKKSYNLKDSLFKEKSQNKLNALHLKYETQKKEQAIKILNKEKALQKTRLKQQRIINYTTATGLFMLLLLSFLIYKRYRDKTKANHLLTEKNHQINQQKEEITAQRDEIESQRDEITAQRDNLHTQKQQLEKANNELTQSISYARFIQSAALPTKKVLDSIIPNRFILFIPQNIVGGDFYWATQKEGKSILIAADCTGHGVPGGFMSMLGMSLLNEIINKEGHTSPETILNKLRDYLINSLHQSSQAGSLKDGMDISIIAIDRNQNKLTCAGANNPIFMIAPINGTKSIPERAVSNEKYILQEIQVDKMPISIGYEMKKFKQKEFELNNIKSIYLLSDGFADQFGGPKNKKFMRKNLKELLLEISEKPLHQQHKILKETFEDWKGNTPQFDDVMIIGLEP